MDIQWPLVLFTLFAGSAGGAMVLLCFAELFNFGRKVGRYACYVIAVLLVIGGICSIFHLAQRAHIMSVLTNLGSLSGVSLELIGLMVCFVLIVIYWLFCREGQNATVRRVFGILCGIAGIVFCWIQGDSYVIAARPFWDTLLLPFGYWASGIACGGVVFCALLVFMKEEAAHIKRMCVIVLVELVIQLVAYLVFGIFVGTDALVENAILFWGCEIVVGCCITAACVIAVWRGANTKFMYVALIAVIIGAIVFRCMMWVLGEGYIPNLFELAETARGYVGW